MKNGTRSSTVPSIPSQVERALALRSEGLLAEALEVLACPCEFNANLYAVRGGIEFSLGRFHEAALSFSTVTMSQPDNLDAYFNLAFSLQHSERWDAAAEAFELVLRRDPDWTEARLGLGACLLEMKRAEEALDAFNRISTGDRRRTALFGKAVALQLLDRVDEAAEIYARLLASDPYSEEVLGNWIAMSIETHDLELVREHSLRLLDICPDSAIALRGLATVALHHGDPQAAASYCGRLLDLSPDSLEAWHNFRIAIDQFEFGFAERAFAVHSGGKR